jgi:hypothetical protein
MPRIRLRDLVTRAGEDEAPNHSGVATIYREDGQRLVSIRIRLNGASLGDVRAAVSPLIEPPYRAQWVDR